MQGDSKFQFEMPAGAMRLLSIYRPGRETDICFFEIKRLISVRDRNNIITSREGVFRTPL
jgi:hypothetical protein